MGFFSKLVYGYCSIITVLIVGVVLYFKANVVELSVFPEINKHLTSDLWKDKYQLKDTKLIIDNHNNTSAAVLDDEGLLNITGWTYANKMNAKKKRVYPVLWGHNKLSYLRFKHIDSYSFDVEEYNLRITGYGTGLHKYILGMYKLEFFNWKTKEYVEHQTFILPKFDTYAFRDNTVNFYKIHYKRSGLEITVVRGKDKDWVVTMKVKLDKPKLEVDIMIAENPGLSHIDTFDGKNRAYWLRRYGNANNLIKSGIWRFGSRPKRIHKDSEFDT